MTAAPNLPPRFTFDDYLSWPDETRLELIAGKAVAMAPPTTWHQEVALNLGAMLHDAFRGKECRPFVAPIGVKLSDEDVFEPDLVVVCERDQMRGSHIEGAPRLIVEILSPSTEATDRHRKLPCYASHGVQEVWLIRPHPAIAEVLSLDGETYRLTGIFRPPETLVSQAFPGLQVPLDPIFDFWQPPDA
jgi:Uma2 family endonuclease